MQNYCTSWSVNITYWAVVGLSTLGLHQIWSIFWKGLSWLMCRRGKTQTMLLAGT